MRASEQVTNDVARFIRPPKEAFSWITAEYWRWYDEEHRVRTRPLDADELIRFLMTYRLCSYDEAEHDVAFDSNALSGDVTVWERVKREAQRLDVPVGYFLARPWLGIWAEQAPRRYKFADLELRSAA